MGKNKHWKITGRFYVEFDKIVAAKTEAQAIRKARDSVVKNRKIKTSDFAKDEVQAFHID